MISRLLIMAALLLPFPALAAPLVADMSTYRIDMDANFTGTRVFLFGARNEGGDVVVVIRGPARDYILRKKERIAGVWLNSSRMKFFNVPAFYALASNKPLSAIEQPALLRQLGLGERNLLAPASDPRLLEKFPQYADAFLDYQHAERHYSHDLDAVQYMGETLFKTVIEFPDSIPPGKYTAEIYLINDSQIIGQQTLPLAVNKTGLDAWLYNLAHDWPALYGLLAVSLALSAGWFGSRLFEKI